MAEAEKQDITQDSGATVVRHKAFAKILQITKAGEYPFLVGPMGSGKTTIGEQIAKELGLSFAYAGAVDSPYQLRGFRDGQGRYNKTPFVIAYENGGVFLQDEMDASDPQALVSLNAAIANRLLDTPEGMIKMHPDFHLIGAANTSGTGATLQYTGRNQLDAATLDRYTNVTVDYDPDLERHIALTVSGKAALPLLSLVHQMRVACKELKIRHEVSTRTLNKGLNFMRTGSSLSEAFEMAALDKLPPEDIEKVLKRIDKTLEDFDVKAGLKQTADFSSRIGDVAERLKAYTDAREKLDEVLKSADRTTAEAFGLAGKVGAGIASANQMLDKLKGVVGMLEGLAQAAPVLEAEAKKALQDIGALSAGPQ